MPDQRADATDIVFEPPQARGGAWVVWSAACGTALFAVVTLLAVPMPSVRGLLVWVDTILFLVGTVGFLVAIAVAGRRALGGVGVRATGLFLAGFARPRDQLVFRTCLGSTVVLGLGVALVVGTGPGAGPYVLDIPATAYGILVPIFPPAMAGIHGARYCSWPAKKP